MWSCGVRIFFINDFVQLGYSTLTFFLTWNHCIIALTFPKNGFFYLHMEIRLDIGHKFNVHKTYVSLMYVLLPGECEEALKPMLLKKSYQPTTCSKTKINTGNQGVKSVQV